MALHHTGGGLHQAVNMLGPVFVVPATTTYWADMEVTGPGSVQLINATTQAVLASCPGSVNLTAGVSVQFQAIGTTAATKAASGRIIEYHATGGGER